MTATPGQADAAPFREVLLGKIRDACCSEPGASCTDCARLVDEILAAAAEDGAAIGAAIAEYDQTRTSQAAFSIGMQAQRDLAAQEPHAAPDLGDWPAILADVTQQRDDLRELLDEVGVLAANAPEDDGSFAVCEQIAMRIAAAGVPDTTPIDEWPDPENPVTGRTVGAAAAPELRAAMAESGELRKLIASILGTFKDAHYGDSKRSDVGKRTFAKWRERAGLPS